MTQAIQDKNASVKLINDAIDKLNVFEQDLQDQNIANSTKVPSQEAEYKLLFDFFNDQNLNPLEFVLIQQNYDAVDNLEKYVKNEITWFVDTKQLLIDTYDELSNYETKNDFPNVDNALLDKLVREKIVEPEADEIKTEEDALQAQGPGYNDDPNLIAQLQLDIVNIRKKWDQIATTQLIPFAEQELLKYKKQFFQKIKVLTANPHKHTKVCTGNQHSVYWESTLFFSAI
jgi:hypothetical protein